MSKIIQYGSAGSISWEGQQNEEINFRPRFIGTLPTLLGITILFTVKSKITLHFLGNLSRVLMPYSKGFQGGKLADKLQKTFYLEEFKAETAFDKHDYKDMIFYEVANQGGLKQNDIEGTPILDAERKVFFDAVQSDVVSIFWLGDKAKVHATAGEYPDGTPYAAGSPDKYYNQIDGVLKNLKTDASPNPNSDEVQFVPMAPMMAPDEADTLFKNMYNLSKKVLRKLKDKGELRFYVTDKVLQNYEDTLKADNLESSRKARIEGVDRLTWNGIPILPLDIDEQLASDFNGVLSPNWAILTTPKNLTLVLNTRSNFAETKFWFNPDENENRQRTQFEFGANYILPELVTVSY